MHDSNETTRAGAAWPAAWAVGAMVSIQLGAALSSPMLAKLGPTTASWLRLTCAAAFLCLAVRPRLNGRAAAVVGAPLLLGVASAALTLCYFEAIARIPMGVATTIEFLGPLGIALVAARRRRDRLFGLVAAAGILLLVRGEQATARADALGYVFAAGAGVSWASYILLTKRVGARFSGLEGLAISMLTAALVSAPFGIAQGISRVSWWDLPPIAGIAFLVPLLPYVLETMALRRMGSGSFGVLMSLEPAISACLGYVLLGQGLSISQGAGIFCTVSASIAVTLAEPAASRQESSALA